MASPMDSSPAFSGISPLRAALESATMRLYIFAAGSISRSARPVMKSTAYFFPFRVQVIMGLALLSAREKRTAAGESPAAACVLGYGSVVKAGSYTVSRNVAALEASKPFWPSSATA